ncbi:3'-5' exonuclease for RNA 3' ss-tail, partial [Schizosaccharomyces japonicus yFS275]
LPAYAIDNSVTTEVDDAISIEETADNSHWIHIHISNPTSSFDLKSDIAKTAEILGQSLYLPTATRYMLPIKYTKKFWSLDANSTKQRALTFSGKLGHNGELLDYKIRPSIIRRLLRLTPQEVDRALGDQHPTRSWTLLKRVEKVDESVSSKLDPITTSNLKKILQCASQFNMRRQNNGAFSLLQPSFDVNVQLRYFTAQNQNLNPVLWSAFPDIELLVNDTSITKTNLLVSECMILAGVIAARFCKDHDVPGVFRCQQLAFPSTTIRDLFRRGLEHRKLHGTISLETASSFVPYLTSAYLSDEPKTHQSLGLTKGYMQVTSPLRRYGDLFMHYQIQCVLAGRDQDVVDKHFLKNMLPLWAKKEKSQKNFGKYCYRFWALLLISMLPKELLPECHGVVQLNSALSPVIILDEFGVSARLDTNIDANYKQKLGKRCAVTIQEINPVMNQLIVRLAE